MGAMLLAVTACGGSDGDADPIDAYLGTWVNPCVQLPLHFEYRQDVLAISKSGPSSAAVTVRHNTFVAAGCTGATDSSTAVAGTVALQGEKALAGIQWSKARFTFPATSRLELVARDGADLLISVQLQSIEFPGSGLQVRDPEGYPDRFEPLPGYRLQPTL